MSQRTPRTERDEAAFKAAELIEESLPAARTAAAKLLRELEHVEHNAAAIVRHLRRGQVLEETPYQGVERRRQLQEVAS